MPADVDVGGQLEGKLHEKVDLLRVQLTGGAARWLCTRKERKVLHEMRGNERGREGEAGTVYVGEWGWGVEGGWKRELDRQTNRQGQSVISLLQTGL